MFKSIPNDEHMQPDYTDLDVEGMRNVTKHQYLKVGKRHIDKQQREKTTTRKNNNEKKNTNKTPSPTTPTNKPSP